MDEISKRYQICNIPCFQTSNVFLWIDINLWFKIYYDICTPPEVILEMVFSVKSCFFFFPPDLLHVLIIMHWITESTTGNGKTFGDSWRRRWSLIYQQTDKPHQVPALQQQQFRCAVSFSRLLIFLIWSHKPQVKIKIIIVIVLGLI